MGILGSSLLFAGNVQTVKADEIVGGVLGQGTPIHYTNSIPGGDLEDVIHRLMTMEPPADGNGIKVEGEITAQPLTPTPAHFPPMFQKARMGEMDAWGVTAEKGASWTASNGVTLMFDDMWSEIAFSQGGHTVGEGHLYYGGGLNYFTSALNLYSNRYEPNTPEWWAAKELEYDQDIFSHQVVARSGGFVISPPPVATVDSFQKEISVDDTFRAYREKMDFYAQYRASGTIMAGESYNGKIVPVMGLIHLIMHEKAVQVHNRVMDPGGATFYLETPYSPEEKGYYYCLELYNNPDPLDWNILYNSLKRITPDADTLYWEIYKQAYSDNPTFPDLNQWVDIGEQTRVAVGMNEYYANLMFFIKDRNLYPNADGTELPAGSNAIDVRYQRFGWN